MKKFNLTTKKLFLLVGLFFIIGCGNLKHRIEINSNPDLANVYIDDKLIGLTPIQTELSNGTYAIKIEKKSYFSYLSTFDITSNEVLKFNLKKYTREVLLKYNLKPDLFFINGQQIKPEKKLILPIGRADIFAYKKNHPFIKKSIVIKLIKANYLKIDFVERKGGAQVEIDSLPPGAKVFLDGLKIGKTPVKFSNLYSGKYQWQLKMPGYKDEFIGIGLKKKEKRSFKVKLIQDKFRLELIFLEKGRINLYDTDRKVLLSTDVDKSGVNIKLPSNKYLIEYFQGKNSVLKEINLLSNTSVLIPRQKKMDFIEVPMEGIAFGELLFAVSDEEKIYFVDAEKGVFDSSKNVYLPKVFTSDWKNCFIAENELYLFDSLHVYKGSLKEKSDWQEIYQAPNGFIKATYPIEGGILVLSQSEDWSFLLVDRAIAKKKREIPLHSLKKEIDFEEVDANQFAYYKKKLYLLHKKKLKVTRVSMNFKTPITHTISLQPIPSPKAEPINYDYNSLQVVEDRLYLWSQKEMKIHIYSEDGKFLEAHPLPVKDFIYRFIINKNKIWLQTNNRVFCFEITRS